ncbi:Glycine-rich RNA-binding protein blt801-like protein, partial [Drosera capensis]
MSDNGVSNYVRAVVVAQHWDLGGWCYVGGLALAIDDQSWRELSLGTINSGTRTSMGLGFVSFATEQAMRNAIHGMNGRTLDGHTIMVKEDYSRRCGVREAHDPGFGAGGGGGYFSRGSECYAGKNQKSDHLNHQQNRSKKYGVSPHY